MSPRWTASLIVLVSLLAAVSPLPVSAQNWVWEPTGGPYTGAVETVAVTGDGSLVTGVRGGPVYVQPVGDTSWVRKKIDHAVRQSLTDSSGTVYLGIEWGEFSDRSEAELFLSRDNGQSFERSVLPAEDFSSVVPIPDFAQAGPDSVYALTDEKIYLTTDQGRNWAQIARNEDSFTPRPLLELAGTPTGQMVVLDDHERVFRSPDYGASWTRTDSLAASFIYDLRAASRDTFWAATNEGIFRSIDGGQSWTLFTEGLPEDDRFRTIGRLPHGDLVLSGGKSDLYRSSDGGETWALVRTFFSQIRDFAATSNGDLLLATAGDKGEAFTQGGLHRSDSQLTGWTRIGVVRATVTEVTTTETHLFGASDRGAFRSSDGGDTWTKIGEQAGHFVETAEGNLLRDGGSGGKVWFSKDDGDTWTPAQTGLPGGGGVGFVRSAGDEIYTGYGIDDGVYRTTDEAGHWTLVGLENVSILDLYAHDADTVWAGTPGGLFRSPDRGATWNLAGLRGQRAALVTRDSLGTYYAVVADSGVYRSEQGSSWTLGGDPPGEIHELIPAGDGHLLAATDSSVWMSEDKGRTWTKRRSGFPGTLDVVYDLEFDADHRLFAGTNQGAFRSKTVVSTDRPSTVQVPKRFRLHANYPNPFNPSTTIVYELSQPTEVRLTVYDLLGRTVRVLVDRYRTAGRHAVRFNGSGLPSGTYLYRLQTESVTQTRTMMLIK